MARRGGGWAPRGRGWAPCSRADGRPATCSAAAPAPPTPPHTPAVARIALVKPEKARAIEDMIIGAARKGALKEKVSEDSLIGLLEQVNEQTQATSKISFQRRNMWDDDD